METNIQIFENEQFGQVRTMVDENGNPLFVASDIAKMLGYRNAYTMTRSLDDDEKGAQIVCTLGGTQRMTVISESGFYHAVLMSRVEKAKAFKHWVTSEVLPQIRRTGGYIPLAEHTSELDTLNNAMAILNRTLDEKRLQLLEQLPKVAFAEAVLSADGSIFIRDLAKLITQNGVNVGQTRLFRWMRQHGYLFQRETRPLQKWVEQGLFDTTVRLVMVHGKMCEYCVTKVTGLGQRYFLDGFMSGRFTL